MVNTIQQSAEFRRNLPQGTYVSETATFFMKIRFRIPLESVGRVELFPASEEFGVLVLDGQAGAEQLKVMVGAENECERRSKIL